MILILEIAPPQAAKLGSTSRQTFRAAGGMIGRATDSDWVLPHTKVSGHHAVITYRDGVFYIEDRSKNGVCLNSSANRLPSGRPHALKSGDRVLIDPYVIHVSVTPEPQDESRRPSPAASSSLAFGGANPFEPDDPFAPHDPFQPPGFLSPAPSYSPSPLEPSEAALSGQELDPLKLLGGEPRRAPARNAQTARDLDRSSPLEAHYTPPAVEAAPVVQPRPAFAPLRDAPLIPDDYDPLAPDDPEQPVWDPPRVDAAVSGVPAEPEASPPPLPPPPSAIPAAPASFVPPTPPSAATASVAPPTPPSAAPAPPHEASASVSGHDSVASDLAAVLAGAGLGQLDATPELAESFGRILRVVVSGVMDVLRARQQIKDEFRMRMTHFRPADNNPLKFSANVDDALHNLLVKRNAAYLGPVEAFEDAFDDLRNHQIAMLAGMRVAYEFMLAQFDADHLQEGFDRQVKKGSLLSVPAKLRYWDLYREQREEMIKDPEASFRKLFGDEFAKAYEEQLRQLKVRSSAGRT